MTDKPLLHPEKDELVAFGLGKLEPDEATKIETHLGECEACCETLLDLKDDTFVELVRKSPEPRQPTHDADANVSSGKTEPTDGVATDDAISAETMLVEAGVSRGLTDLPAQLEDHPRYRIIELIGKGGMGDVYKAEHRLMDRPVALKLINQDLVKNTQAVERFQREVRAAARLTHPNIVTAHDAEQAGDVHFLVMEFVDGVDLASEVRNRGSLPIPKACDYIRQAAEGLQHAHEKGMVHRDIKPHNLMLSRDGQVRILDFGLASFATESALIEADATDTTEGTPTRQHLTTLGSVMGTPDYIAPEQARDAHSADIRADVYSLGCTLCYLLTGEAPFAADSVVNKLKAHEEHEPPSLQALRDDVPPELADVVTRMMAKNPGERFQTPSGVATALSPFVDAHQSGSVNPQRSKRKKLFAISTALLVSLVLLAGVVIYLATDTGQIEIDATGLNLPDAKIVLLEDGKEYARFNLKSDEKPQTISAGEYEVQLQNATADLKMEVWSKRRGTSNWGEPADHENEPIVLYRGGGLMVQVTRQQSPVASVTEQDRLQGRWVPVSGHMRTKAMSAEQLSNMSVTLEGNRVTLTDPDSGRPIPSGTLTVDTDRDRNHITMTAPDGSETLPGIFQFEGDRLRLAWVDEDYARPTDFSPSDTPDHMTVVLEQAPLAGAAPGETERDVLKAANEFLAVMDAGTFGQLYDLCASWAKRQTTRGKTAQTHQKIRDSFGKAVQRTLYRAHQIDQDPNLPKGRYAVVLYKSRFERQPVLWESLVLNVDTDGQWRVITYAWTLEPPTLPAPKTNDAPATTQKKQAALTAAQQWLNLVDSGQYGDAWEACAEQTRKADDKQTLVNAYTRLFQSVGKLESRELLTNKYATDPSGEFVNIQYDTQFAKTRVTETVALTKEKDDQWRVSGYFHEPLASAPTPLRQTPPQRKTGILTNPPNVPEDGLPTGKNLIGDPSLEDTRTGQLPKGWFAWLDDGPDFKCEVVEGGVSGKQCVQISGTGTRGVVFATSIPMDRTKRYALKGHVKVEGEAGTWAVIKLNYFNKSGWLGVDDRVGVTTSDFDWKFFEKTDIADKYPSATLIVPTCHIEGNGTAWFDDLEVIAYDRDKLPDNFDAKHGKNNRNN